MTDQLPEPFFLIVVDRDRGFFCVQGPMTNARSWHSAARHAQDNERRIVFGPTGPDRAVLAADYLREHKLRGVPPGSIVGPGR